MAKSPRIQVSLSPDTYGLISRLADLQNGSRSAIIGELVEELAPHLESMLQLLESAMSVKADRREAVAEQAQNLLDLMRPHAEVAQGALASMAAVLDDAQEGPAEEPQPPYSNTGVRSGVSHCNSTNGRKSS